MPRRPAPSPRSRTAGARPGEREVVGLFLVEPLRGVLFDYFFARVPVFGAELETEGDHLRLKKSAEKTALLRLGKEGHLKGYPPERLVVFGLYDRLTREEAKEQVLKLSYAPVLGRHVRLVVASLRHTLSLDRTRLKEAGLPTTATFDEALAAGLGPVAVVGEALFEMSVLSAPAETVCEAIEEAEDQGQAVLEVVSGPTAEEAQARAEQIKRELYYALKYAALGKGDLNAVRVKATRWTRYRPSQCDPSWA